MTCFKWLTCIILFNPHKSEVGTNIIPILEMDKLKLREVKKPAVGDALYIIEPGFKLRSSDNRSFSLNHYVTLPSGHRALIGTAQPLGIIDVSLISEWGRFGELRFTTFALCGKFPSFFRYSGQACWWTLSRNHRPHHSMDKMFFNK